jgi:hypothetical protein
MNAIVIITLCFCSLVTTFRAIYLILTKEFRGSKSSWILIVMIAFVGPVLWILKGKKLVSSTKTSLNNDSSL